jgi:Raf kinase inhibitor-like YbhB/YbcL family protein
MRSFMFGAVLFAAVLSACSTDDGRDMSPPRADQQESVAPATTVNDPESFDSLPDPSEGAFSIDGPWGTDDAIDSRYTCDGRDISPPLAWSGGPSDAVAYAIVMTDLDAPEYAHWTVANIDVGVLTAKEGQVPPLAVVAQNGKGLATYSGPCPPTGQTHTYQISIYALGQIIEAQNGDPAPALRAAIETAALDIASTTFTYSR